MDANAESAGKGIGTRVDTPAGREAGERDRTATSERHRVVAWPASRAQRTTRTGHSA